jgi:two-component system sensor histidine kinase UhpB
METTEDLSRIYQALFEASHDVIVLQDEADRIMDVNPRAAELTGYSLEELRQMSASRDLVVAEDVRKVRKILDEVIRGAPREYEIRWRAKDGRVIDFDVISLPLRLPGRKSAWTFCSLRDVTHRKKVERELRESEKRLQQIIATLPVGLTVVDRSGDVALANSAMKRIWGTLITSGPARWAESKGYWADSGRRIEASEWASVRALHEGKTILGELIDIETFDGRHKTVENSAAPIRGETGEVVGAIIVNEDVTERVRAEKGLRQAVEELKALSLKLVEVQETERHDLSRELHDRIGQNLTALGINLEIVKTRLASGDSESASRLQDSRDLLKGTFDAMIDLLAELRPPMLDDLGLLVALKWYGDKFAARTGLAVSISGDERRLGPPMDIVLFRIAQEALNNVAKHARARHVDVRLEPSDDEWMLSISDDGVGVTAPEGARRAPGGFGMVTMRERARAIGGRLEVQRRHEGGTSVVVKVRP